MALRIVVALMLALVAGGCAHVRPREVAGCHIDAYPLAVDANGSRAFARAGVQARGAVASRSFQQALTGMLSRRAPAITGPAPPPTPARELLVLSGGSQHGLFGTGFYLGLPAVPTYDVVTGVSTGALQSTFLFLANQPVATDRVYPADLGYTAEIPRHASNIADLALASSIMDERSLLKVAPFGIVGGVVHGAEASLDPLRRRLFGFISPDTLRAVAAARDAGRRLFVGVVDVDDGNGYALDLTELASRIGGLAAAADIDALRRCYADALIASSSVPLAAYPVSMALHDVTSPDPASLQHDLMIDGGARFGVFFRQIQAAARAADAQRAAAGERAQPTNLSLVVNGVLYSEPWRDSAGRRMAKWDALGLGLRTVDILENQVYRFSVEQVEDTPLRGGTLKMAFISNEGLGEAAEEPDAHMLDGKSCAAWSAIDDLRHVKQFHPRYMACLLDYGRSRGRTEAWNRIVRSAPPVARGSP